jgi:hypothetical protein
VVGRQQHHRDGCEDLREHSGSHFFTLLKIQFLPTHPTPLMATSNSPTFGQSNSPRQDGQIISLLV